MAKKARSNGEFTEKSKLKCTDCEREIHVGTAGSKNLEIHQGSKACRAECERKAHARNKPKQKPNGSLRTFFGLKAAVNPPTVSAPSLPIHAPEIPSPSLVVDDARPSTSPTNTRYVP